MLKSQTDYNYICPDVCIVRYTNILHQPGLSRGFVDFFVIYYCQLVVTNLLSLKDNQKRDKTKDSFVIMAFVLVRNILLGLQFSMKHSGTKKYVKILSFPNPQQTLVNRSWQICLPKMLIHALQFCTWAACSLAPHSSAPGWEAPLHDPSFLLQHTLLAGAAGAGSEGRRV